MFHRRPETPAEQESATHAVAGRIKRGRRAARRSKACERVCACTCCKRWARRAVWALVLLLVLGMLGCCTYDWLEQRRAHTLLDEAHAQLGEGEGVKHNLRSEYLYKQALAKFQFSEAAGLRHTTLNAAAARLLRMPMLALRIALGGSSHGGWAAVRARLAQHAGRLSDAASGATAPASAPAAAGTGSRDSGASTDAAA